VTPAAPDPEIVGRRLRLLHTTLDELDSLGEIDAARLQSEPISRAATERLIQVAVDLAIDINAHLLVGLTGQSPTTGRASFLDLAGAGIISQELGARLAPAAGLRNVLVHHYTDIDVALVASAVHGVRAAFREYLQQVAAALDTLPGQPGCGS
jgi:uncharacterized protein YutE (UPF0331/DUF86 family)